MPTITIKDLPQDVYEGITLRAEMNHRSVQAEVRLLLQEAAAAIARPHADGRVRNLSITIGRWNIKSAVNGRGAGWIQPQDDMTKEKMRNPAFHAQIVTRCNEAWKAGPPPKGWDLLLPKQRPPY